MVYVDKTDTPRYNGHLELVRAANQGALVLSRRLPKNGRAAGFSEALFGMVRDVLIASMNKGQFPIAIIGAAIALFIWRIPPGNVAEIAHKCFDLLSAGWLLGYVLFVLSIAGWFYHAKWQRKVIDREMQRLSEERNRLQQALLDRKLGTSKK